MKAAVVEKPGMLVVREVPMPEVGDYDVLCEILFGSTCTGTDLHLIGGKTDWGITYPSVLGHESVGRIVELGKKVRNLKIGEVRVSVNLRPSKDGKVKTCFGGFAEYGIASDCQAMKEDGVAYNTKWERQLPVPEGFDPRAATMIITWKETFSYLTRMGDVKGKNVLVVGSGGTGLAFVSIAKVLGAAKIVMLGNTMRQDIAAKIGVHTFYDYKNESLHKSGETFDFIVESVGKIGVMDKVLGLLKPGGVIGIYGMDDDRKVTINPSNAKGTFTIYNSGYNEVEKHFEIIELMKKGKLDASLFMDLEHPYPLERIADAYKAVESKQEIKALVRIRG